MDKPEGFYCNMDGCMSSCLTSDRIQFSVEHALTCSYGGFRYPRHNEIRDAMSLMLAFEL